MLLNKVFLIGRLTRDPELKYTNSGLEICDVGFAIASPKSEETSFVDLTFFGKQAVKLCEGCTKGDEILVEGRLVQERWEAQDGGRRARHKVIVGTFTRSFEKNQEEPEAEPTPAPAKKVEAPNLPF